MTLIQRKLGAIDHSPWSCALCHILSTIPTHFKDPTMPHFQNYYTHIDFARYTLIKHTNSRPSRRPDRLASSESVLSTQNSKQFFSNHSLCYLKLCRGSRPRISLSRPVDCWISMFMISFGLRCLPDARSWAKRRTPLLPCWIRRCVKETVQWMRLD